MSAAERLRLGRAGPALALTLAAAWSVRADEPAGRPCAAAVHVHSRFSNGDLEPVQLAEAARERGVDAIVLTDSLRTRVTWTVWPFERSGVSGLNRRGRPGVLEHGVGRYLDAVQEARRLVPEVVIVPGVEIAPHYSWSGAPWDDLALHDFDRHLWVVGLGERDLRDLPVIENARWSNTRFDPRRLVLPAILLAAGSAAWMSGRRHRRRRMAVVGAATLAVGAVLAWDRYPFGTFGDDPYAAAIDWIRQRGGVVYWSYPEASYPDVTLGAARMVSRPHPEDLVNTDGYHGFEGLYGDEIRATEPGGIWDRLWLDALGGRRSVAPYVVTGIDFHGFDPKRDAWHALDGGITVLFPDERSERGVVEALSEGRGYATYSGDRRPLRLEIFEVSSANGSAGSHGQSVAGPSPVVVRWQLVWADGGPAGSSEFDLRIVADGEVAGVFRGMLPLSGRLELDLPPGEHFVRLAASAGRRHRVLGNPVRVSVR